MIITPLTELDALNEILNSIGEDGITTLEDVSENVDATTAKRFLESVSREIQQEGWDFNTYPTMVLQPSTINGKIRWDSSWLRTGGTTYRNRGGFVYDVTNNTDIFSTAITLSNVVQCIPFDELPDVFRKYVTARASLGFASRFLGDADIESALSSEVGKAYADVITYELDMQKPNIFNNTSVTEVGTR